MMGLLGIALFVAGLVVTILAVWRSQAALPPTSRELVALVSSMVAALLVSGALLVVPIYAGTTQGATLTRSGQVLWTSSESRATLLQVNGPRVIVPLALPVLVAALPLLFFRTRWRASLEAGAATLLAAFTVVAGFSIGLFYLPSAAAMLTAAALGCRGNASA